MDPLLSIIEPLIRNFGYPLLFAIVFAESGLFFGFFFPGDSLLFTAGLLAGQGLFNVYILAIGIMISAILGDQVGYWTGKKFGKKLFNKPGSLFFDPKHITQAEAFYQKHGKKTIVLARFVPAVRTFAPIVAGIGNMHYPTFAFYNITGGILWTLLFVGLGYILGNSIPEIGSYFTVIILAVVLLSIIPLAWEVLRKKKS